MRFRLAILFVGLATALGGAGIAAPAQAPSAGTAATNRKPQPGPFVPDGLNLTDPEIREIDLDGLKKLLLRDPKDTRPLLVNFWATWCDGCREEFPDLVKIDADYTAARLNFVAVSLDEVADIKTAVPKFLKEMKAAMP